MTYALMLYRKPVDLIFALYPIRSHSMFTSIFGYMLGTIGECLAYQCACTILLPDYEVGRINRLVKKYAPKECIFGIGVEGEITVEFTNGSKLDVVDRKQLENKYDKKNADDIYKV